MSLDLALELVCEREHRGGPARGRGRLRPLESKVKLAVVGALVERDAHVALRDRSRA